MLLEYNQDTNELELQDKAIELRKRVAGRKLESAVEKNVLDADGLLQLNLINRNERRTHMNESVSITDIEVKERIALNRADQHLAAVSQVRTLEKDIARASRLTKSKFDALDDLERRVKSMRGLLHNATLPSVESAISQEILTNPKLVKLEKQFAQCELCNRRILVGLLEGHTKMCSVMKQNADSGTLTEKEKLKYVADVGETLITSLATFKPHPPRNFKVSQKGITFIEWEWEPPVIDGGLVVTDYEISYHVKHFQFDFKNNKYIKWEEDRVFNTSNWLYRENPVCNFGYRICNLRANSEYSQWKIRCYNIRGWSEWVNMLEHENDKIILEKEIPPTPPLFISCDHITSSCLHLNWSPPYFDGGLPITEYLIYYTVIEVQQTVTERARKTEKHLSYSTESPETNTIIRNIPDNTDVINIYICAKNSGNLIGAKGFCKQTVVRTLKCSRYKQLKRELDFAMASTSATIDTDFFTGIKQRLNRVNHIRRVKEELDVTEVDELEENEINEWITIKETKALKKKLEEEALKKAKEIEMMQRFKAMEDMMEDAMEDAEEEDDHSVGTVDLEEVEEEIPISEETALASKDANIRINSKGMKVMVVKKFVKKKGKKKKKSTQETQKSLAAQRLQGFGFTFAERRKHFQKKLLSFDKIADKLQQEKMLIDKNRVENTSVMRRKEKQLFSYQLEKERLKNYHGKSITSSVLTGADMQYRTSDYIDKLNTAYENVIQEIANLKYLIISNENRRQIINQELIKNEEAKKERLAKYHEFESHYTKTMKFMHRLNMHQQQQQSSNNSIDSQDSLIKVENDRILKLYFRKLIEHRLEMKALKQRILIMFSNWLLRYKRNAFNKLKYSAHSELAKEEEDANLKNQLSSVGSLLLEEAFDKRIQLQDELREVLSDMSTIKQNLTLQQISNKNIKKLKNQITYQAMEEGMNHYHLFHYQNIHIFYEANLYAQENKFELASRLYEAQIISIRAKAQLAYDALPRHMKSKMFKSNVLSRQDIKILSICHGKLGEMFMKMNENARGIVEFDRQLSLAKEISDKVEESNAYYGLGIGYLNNYDYENALRYLIIAQAHFLSCNRIQKYYLCLQSIKECYMKIHRTDKVLVYEEKLLNTERTIHKKCKTIHEILKDLENRLQHTSAEIEHVITIERTTYQAMEYKKFIMKKEEELDLFQEELNKQLGIVGKIENTLDAIQKEMIAAVESDEPEMWSELVHETPQIVEIEELKQRLKQRSKIELEELKLQKQIESKILIKIKNVENEIEEKHQLLSLEEGNLMKHSRHDKPFRVIGLCLSNAIGNEVTGTATGGYEEFAAAEGNNIHLIDYHTGELKFIFHGTTESKLMLQQVTGEKDNLGHVGVVTCLLHDGAMIFSGGVDERIICWQTQTRLKLRVLTGHEGAIVALAAETKYLISSAADVTMRLWNKITGQQIRVIFGHSKSVLAMEIGSKWLCTGSADFEVRVWKIDEITTTKTEVETVTKLNGHNCAVTCVKYGSVEVLSGDNKGRVFIWWLKTGTILRKCEIHHGPIKCLQFDAVHIVTGSTDNAVCITDIASGEVLQSLRGHEKAVLAIAFDSERILSVGGDNTVRYWAWGKKSGPQDKFHILEPNETLAMVSKHYTIPIDTLMKWNGIRNNRNIYTGMKLIVKKGDPNKLTDAEKLNEEREMRQSRGLALTTKKLSKKTENLFSLDPEADALKSKFSNKDLISDEKYARIHSLAMNMDYFSLGNRLFGEEKRKLDLFPDTTMKDSDNYSLAARIKLGLEEKATESIVGGEQHYISDKPATETTNKRIKDYRKHLKQTKYFVSAANEDEWGHVADSIGDVMLDMMIELYSYDIVMDQKREMRDKQSVIGRIYQYQNKKLKTTDEKKQKKSPSKVKWKKSKRKKSSHGDGTEGSLETNSIDGSSTIMSDSELTSDTSDQESASDNEKNKNHRHHPPPSSVAAAGGLILHSREEMNPIPEEKEDEEEEEVAEEVAVETEAGGGEGGEKIVKKTKKKKSLIKQEAAINQFFDEMIAENLHGPLMNEQKNPSNDNPLLPTPPAGGSIGIAAGEEEPLLPMISSKASKERFPSNRAMDPTDELIDQRAQPKNSKNNNSSSSSTSFSLPPLPSSQK